MKRTTKKVAWTKITKSFYFKKEDVLQSATKNMNELVKSRWITIEKINDIKHFNL